MIARAASVLSDGIVLVLTVIKTRRQSWNMLEVSEDAQTVRGVLFWNGEEM